MWREDNPEVEDGIRYKHLKTGILQHNMQYHNVISMWHPQYSIYGINAW